MPLNFRSSLVLPLAIVLAACGSSQDPDADVMGDPPTSQIRQPTQAGDGALSPSAVQLTTPVEVSSTAITLGTSAENGRVVSSSLASFTMSDTIYAGVAGGHPPGTNARAYWTNQKTGRSDKQEMKEVADDGVVFTFDRATGMKPGRYSVQIDIAGKPVGIVDFEVH